MLNAVKEYLKSRRRKGIHLTIVETARGWLIVRDESGKIYDADDHSFYRGAYAGSYFDTEEQAYSQAKQILQMYDVINNCLE